jgi:DNA polymerase
MGALPPLSLAESIAAAQAWWREAGVDLAYADEPHGWLAPAAPAEGSAPEAAAPAQQQPEADLRPRIGGDPAAWPASLPAFHEWWLTEPSLDAGGLDPRVAPRGAAQAELMILVPMPEAEDSTTLLSGAQGRLLANMLRAMAIPAEQAYLAAALPRHMPVPDWAQLAADGLGDVLRHQLALVAPKRVLVLGRDVLSLLQNDPAQGLSPVSEISIQSATLPVLSSFAPGRLLEHARLRAELWRRWLEWTGGTGE